MAIGFRILERARTPDAQYIERFAKLPVANVSDNMFRMTAGGSSIRPMHGDATMVGAALTVKTAPGDNLMIHKAIDMSKPGDVIVVDGGGGLTNALIGELMLSQAIKRGVVGLVINGAVRDAESFPRRGLPYTPPALPTVDPTRMVRERLTCPSLSMAWSSNLATSCWATPTASCVSHSQSLRPYAQHPKPSLRPKSSRWRKSKRAH